MAKELTHESWKIANIIYCDLLYGPLARDYLKERLETGSCKVGGFDFQEDVYCWVIWKPTDIRKYPEYNGEPLHKILPSTTAHLTREQMETILDAQPWCYI